MLFYFIPAKEPNLGRTEFQKFVSGSFLELYLVYIAFISQEMQKNIWKQFLWLF
jgi:hypothetical protein